MSWEENMSDEIEELNNEISVLKKENKLLMNALKKVLPACLIELALKEGSI